MKELKNDIIRLEKSLHKKENRSNREVLDQYLSENFIEIGKSGHFYNKEVILSRLPSEESYSIESYDYEVRQLSESIVQVIYKTNVNDDHTFRSSLWKKRGESWEMIFHQGTTI